MGSDEADKTKRVISKNLKRFRLKCRLKQSEIAKKAGINSNLYAKAERGEILPGVVTLSKLAKALGIALDDITSV